MNKYISTISKYIDGLISWLTISSLFYCLTKEMIDVLYTILDSDIALIKEHKLYALYKRLLAETNIQY